MEFIDRVSAYPNRYTLTDENGNVSYVFLERADDPIVEGTPLNAETLNSLYLYSEALNYPGCFYREVDGEDEFMNPPLTPGQARSVKRFNGYPVYIAVANVPNLASKGETIRVNMKNFARVVGLSVLFCKNDNGEITNVYPNPWVDIDGVYATARIVDKSVLEIKSGNMDVDYSQYSAICVVEVTKEDAQ